MWLVIEPDPPAEIMKEVGHSLGQSPKECASCPAAAAFGFLGLDK